nr:ribosomal protein S11 [Ceramothamnion sp.]WQF69688.1 ribosomal protein S11 [Ceramothamnion sp.]
MNLQKTFILFIYFSYNNIFFNITDLKGNTIWYFSTGFKKTKGTRKISLISIKSGITLLTNVLTSKKIHIKIWGFTKFKKVVLKLVLKSLNTMVLSFCDLTNLPHNGTKKTKFRRV